MFAVSLTAEWPAGSPPWPPRCIADSPGGCPPSSSASSWPRADAPPPVGGGPPGSAAGFRSYYYFLDSRGPQGRRAVAAVAAADRRPERIEPAGRLTLRHRRHADQAVRPQGPGGRHPPQPHAGAGRLEVPLRPQLGRPSAGSSIMPASAPSACRCWASSTSARRTCPSCPGGRRSRSAPSWRWPPRQVGLARSRLPEPAESPWVVVDGGYAKREFLKPAMKAGFVVVARLRKDAALFDLPPVLAAGAEARPGPAADLRQESAEPGQAGRPDAGMAGGRRSGPPRAEVVTKRSRRSWRRGDRPGA